MYKFSQAENCLSKMHYIIDWFIVLKAPMYYRRANAAIIVYDITSEKSFDEAKQWIKGNINYSIIYIY